MAAVVRTLGEKGKLLTDNAEGVPNDFPALGPIRPYVPGDRVYIDEFSFFHEMHVAEVRAVFGHQDSPGKKVTLSGAPELHKGRTREEGTRVMFHSSVELEAIIPYDAEPGKYEFRLLEAVTVTGQEIPFEEQEEPVDLTLWVMPEPNTPPKFDFSDEPRVE